MPIKQYALCALVFLELVILSFFQTHVNLSVLPFLFFLIGVGIIYTSLNSDIPKTKISFIALGSLSLLMLGYMIHRSPLIFELIPIDYKIADMLPVMEIMAERLLHGEAVYAQIPEIWNGIEPIYLPSLWLPLIMAKLAGIDIRWMSVIGMAGLIPVILFIRGSKLKMQSLIGVLIPLLLFLLWHFRYQLNIMTMSNEGIVFFYYALLGMAVARNNAFGIGVAMCLCLLSRYMLAPWCLLMLVVYYRSEGFQFFGKLLGMGLIVGVTLMTIGQGWSSLDRFVSLPQHYLEALITDPAKYKPLIQESLSFARYFDFSSIASVHQAMGICALLTPIVCFLLWKKYQDSIQLPLFALCSLKISLVVFYALLTMPYHYLYYTSFIVSLCIVSYVLNENRLILNSSSA